MRPPLKNFSENSRREKSTVSSTGGNTPALNAIISIEETEYAKALVTALSVFAPKLFGEAVQPLNLLE